MSDKTTEAIGKLIGHFVFLPALVWGSYSVIREPLALPYLGFLQCVCLCIFVGALLGVLPVKVMK